MKLVFKKDKDAHIEVFQDIGGKEKDFSYAEMIKALINSKKLEEPNIADDFSAAEIKSIKSMVGCINEKISNDGEEEDDDYEGLV